MLVCVLVCSLLSRCLVHQLVLLNKYLVILEANICLLDRVSSAVLAIRNQS